MNRLCNVASRTIESGDEILDQRDAKKAKAIHVLFVGSVDFGSLVHDALLDGPKYRLSIAPDYRALWVTPKGEPIHLVILHNSLSSSELEDATRLVRKQWPHSRILLIRANEGSLDDALYDDRVAPTVTSEILLQKFERLTREWHDWSTGDTEP